MKRAVLLLILAFVVACGSAAAPSPIVSPFGSDPAYASCVIDDGPDASWCPGAPATAQTYYCGTPAPMPPGYGCTGGVTYIKSDPAPAEILCCPLSSTEDGGIGDAAPDSSSACPPPPPHATMAVEDGGACVSECETGYGDCDDSRVNGCETLCPASGAPCCSVNVCGSIGAVCSDGSGGMCPAACSAAGACVCSPPFARDPAYFSCAETDSDIGWCPLGDVPYLCTTPVTSPHYGCATAMSTSPVGLICCH